MQISMSTRVSLPVQGLRLPTRPTAGARRTAAFFVRAEKDSYQVQAWLDTDSSLHTILLARVSGW